MAYPSKFREIEEREGKPIGEVLVELLNELEDISKVARHPRIDMSYDSVYGKVKELGIEPLPRQWRLPEASNA